MTQFRRLSIPGLMEIVAPRFADPRGYFSEVFSVPAFAAAGLPTGFVQDNHSFSASRGVLRGLHFQMPPRAQDKLVRVVRGSVFDVAVDIRRQSPTFGKWVGLKLSAHAGNQMFIPKGFAHGFVTLEDGTEVIYKVSDIYSPEHERAIRFDDPELAIDWPVPAHDIQLSEKDGRAPPMSPALHFPTGDEA